MTPSGLRVREVHRRLRRVGKATGTNVTHDADDGHPGRRRSGELHPLAEGVLVRPEKLGEALTDDHDGWTRRTIGGRDVAAREKVQPHGPQVTRCDLLWHSQRHLARDEGMALRGHSPQPAGVDDGEPSGCTGGHDARRRAQLSEQLFEEQLGAGVVVLTCGEGDASGEHIAGIEAESRMLEIPEAAYEHPRPG